MSNARDPRYFPVLTNEARGSPLSEMCENFHPKNRFGRDLVVLCTNRLMVEDTINAYCDGLEDRVIAKDLLYKFNAWLWNRRGRRIDLSFTDDPKLVPGTRKLFREFLGD